MRFSSETESSLSSSNIMYGKYRAPPLHTLNHYVLGKAVDIVARKPVRVCGSPFTASVYIHHQAVIRYRVSIVTYRS